MTDRTFRFGVVAAPMADTPSAAWQSTATRAEELGYSSLLMPDGLQLLSPFSALAIAGTVTTRLRVGTFVLAGPLRPPRSAAWDGHSISRLLDGRFEFGIGTGRPEMITAAVDELGLPPTTGGQRLAQIEQAVDHLRALDGDRHTPVLMAASGPKARALAARTADIITLAAGPLATREETAAMFADVRAAAGDRADDIEYAANLFVVGEDVPPHLAGFMGVDGATLVARDSLSLLRGATPQAMADELQRRRDAFGTTYISVNSAFMEAFAPVLELLAGQ